MPPSGDAPQADALPALGEAVPAGTLRWRNAAIVGGSALAVAAYGRDKWWQDGFTGRFRAQNEGWFGQETAYGGADKLGHAYANYVSTRLLARGFEAVGNPSDDALRLATWATLALFTGVEVTDAYSKRFRFSREDALMNVAGAGLAWLMETQPALDRLVDFRLLYRPSTDAHGGRQVDPVGDHSGQTFLLVAKAGGVPALREQGWPRFLELALGYGTRGYGEEPSAERSRHLYVGVSLNLAELLRATVFRGADAPGRAQRLTEGVLEFIQVPGTAALADHRL